MPSGNSWTLVTFCDSVHEREYLMTISSKVNGVWVYVISITNWVSLMVAKIVSYTLLLLKLILPANFSPEGFVHSIQVFKFLVRAIRHVLQ